VENIMIGLVTGVVLLGFISLNVLIIRMAFIVSEMATIVKTMYVSVNKIEQMTQATMEASEGFVDALKEMAEDTSNNRMPPQGFFKVFRSEDGKHFANSFEELIKKMQNDPNFGKMSDQDMEELRKLFEDNSSEDDDDDDNKEPWKK